MSEDSRPMTARELEVLMERTFGAGWREKEVVTPVSAFRFADVFAECGLTDPRAAREAQGLGLWQITPPRHGEA